jgi:hypothetical protein
VVAALTAAALCACFLFAGFGTGGGIGVFGGVSPLVAYGATRMSVTTMQGSTRTELGLPDYTPQLVELGVGGSAVLLVLGEEGSNRAKIIYYENVGEGATGPGVGEGGWKCISAANGLLGGRVDEGVYSLSYAFGLYENTNDLIPYHRIQMGDYWVNDPASPFFNQLVNVNSVTKNWDTAQDMMAGVPYYNYGMVLRFDTGLGGSGTAARAGSAGGGSADSGAPAEGSEGVVGSGVAAPADGTGDAAASGTSEATAGDGSASGQGVAAGGAASDGSASDGAGAASDGSGAGESASTAPGDSALMPAVPAGTPTPIVYCMKADTHACPDGSIRLPKDEVKEILAAAKGDIQVLVAHSEAGLRAATLE